MSVTIDRVAGFTSPYRNPPKVRRAVTNEHRTTSAPPVLRDVFGDIDEPGSGPHAFLLEVYPAHSRFGAHFHSVDQFQVFFPSPGAWYQRTPIDVVTCHYADAYTTYGPFGTAQAPMSFLTLRPGRSTLTAHMPGSRDQLRPSRRRTIHAGVDGIADRAAAGGVMISDVIAEHDDGLWAARVDLAGGTVLPPDVDLAGRDDRATPGQYLVIVDGSVAGPGTDHGPGSVAWSAPDDTGGAFDDVRAGPGGASLLVLRFPRAEPRNSA